MVTESINYKLNLIEKQLRITCKFFVKKNCACKHILISIISVLNMNANVGWGKNHPSEEDWFEIHFKRLVMRYLLR